MSDQQTRLLVPPAHELFDTPKGHGYMANHVLVSLSVYWNIKRCRRHARPNPYAPASAHGRGRGRIRLAISAIILAALACALGLM